jgi:hypothetical protein
MKVDAKYLIPSLIAAALFLLTPLLHANDNEISEVNASKEEHGCVETRSLQVLVNTSDPTFQFVLNDGNGLHYGNPFFPRPFGSYYYFNGLIFPGGTIDVNQPNYTLDTRGQPLNEENSLGLWWCTGKVVSSLLALPNVPSEPTDAELINWDFLFKHNSNEPNDLFSYGVATTGINAPQVPLFTVANAVVGGVGENCDACGTLSAKVYFQASTFTLLININFTNPVKYCVNHVQESELCEI